MTKKHDKRDRSIVITNKQANALKPENKQRRRHNEEARRIAYLIHEDLHLSFSQCVHLLVSKYDGGHIIANRNINRTNEGVEDRYKISLFDETTFANLMAKRIEFAKSAKH